MKKVKKPAKPAKRCRHKWVFYSHNDFRDGEYFVCEKCKRTKFTR